MRRLKRKHPGEVSGVLLLESDTATVVAAYFLILCVQPAAHRAAAIVVIFNNRNGCFLFSTHPLAPSGYAKNNNGSNAEF